MYVQDQVVVLGAVSRDNEDPRWLAWRLHFDQRNELLGHFATPEAAQRAVETAIAAG